MEVRSASVFCEVKLFSFTRKVFRTENVQLVSYVTSCIFGHINFERNYVMDCVKTFDL